MSQSGPSDDHRCIKRTIWPFVIWWVVHQASWGVSYITGKLWYAVFQQYIIYMCIHSIWVKAARLTISGAWNGPSGCLWYDEWSAEFPIEFLVSLESCDMQLFNSISYICVSVVYESKRPVQQSPVHGMDHLAVCDMMSGPPRFLWSFSCHWKAVICSFSTVYHIYVYP